MIAYEVVADVEQAEDGRYERYMRETHIPEVLATGCFQGERPNAHCPAAKPATIQYC